VAGVYDLNKEMVLQGTLKQLHFTNPHVSIELTVANPDGTTTDWILTTASVQNLTRQGINKTSMKPGEPLKIKILPLYRAGRQRVQDLGRLVGAEETRNGVSNRRDGGRVSGRLRDGVRAGR